MLKSNKVVILTDSKSSIENLRNHHPKCQSHISNEVKVGVSELSDMNIIVTIQYIPSHIGIEGNEKADCLAQNAHNHIEEQNIPLDIYEIKTLLKKKIKSH